MRTVPGVRRVSSVRKALRGPTGGQVVQFGHHLLPPRVGQFFQEGLEAGLPDCYLRCLYPLRLTFLRGLQHSAGSVESLGFRLFARDFAAAEQPGRSDPDPVPDVRPRSLHDRTAPGGRSCGEHLGQPGYLHSGGTEPTARSMAWTGSRGPGVRAQPSPWAGNTSRQGGRRRGAGHGSARCPDRASHRCQQSCSAALINVSGCLRPAVTASSPSSM